jgi:hypothetical protein
MWQAEGWLRQRPVHSQAELQQQAGMLVAAGLQVLLLLLLLLLLVRPHHPAQGPVLAVWAGQGLHKACSCLSRWQPAAAAAAAAAAGGAAAEQQAVGCVG